METSNKLRYYNYLTTPSGKYCILYEIKNSEYIILLKFLQSENLSAFFNSLDILIEESIPDFKSFNIVDKSYIYLAFCFYNIRSSISIKHPKLGPSELPLTKILDSIENVYIKEPKRLKINDNIEIEYHYPITYTIENENIICNYDTCVSRIAKNNVWQDLTHEESSKLLDVLDTAKASKIENSARLDFSAKFNAFDLPLMEPVMVDINSSNILYLIYNVYSENLESFYTQMYLMGHYMRMDKPAFDSLTPIESSMLLNIMAEDKEKQNKDAKKSGGITIPSNVEQDAFF